MSRNEPKKFLTTKEVATLLKINEKMVYSLINDKGLPATKITGKWLFPKRTVEDWLEAHLVNGQLLEQNLDRDDSVLLIAGSDDPLFQEVISLFHTANPGTTVYYANLGSLGGLKSLRQGQCQIGVCHLLQDDQQEYNFDFVEQEFERMPVLVNFSKRQQGLLIRKGNPKGISTVADLARPDVRIVNRSLGTGTRLLLDYEIAKSEISCTNIKGYDREMSRHLDVGLEVLAGRVDAAPAIRAVAGLLELDFIPFRWERFDLLIAKENFFDRPIQNFLDILHAKEFFDLAQTHQGYDLSLTGKVIFPNT